MRAADSIWARAGARVRRGNRGRPAAGHRTSLTRRRSRGYHSNVRLNLDSVMTLRAVKPQHETRTRILDAAEELFMQHRFDGTSMPLLTTTAGVNLAAVNYHFGSKHALIEAVFRRRLDPMNVARIAELEKLEAQEPASSPEAIIRAFITPGLRLMEDAKGGGRSFVRLLGRTYTEPNKA